MQYWHGICAATGEAQKFLGLAVKRGLRVELHALDLGPGAGDGNIRQRLEHVRHRAERRLDVQVEIGNEARHEDKIERPLPDHLIGDPHIAAKGVSGPDRPHEVFRPA